MYPSWEMKQERQERERETRGKEKKKAIEREEKWTTWPLPSTLHVKFNLSSSLRKRSMTWCRVWETRNFFIFSFLKLVAPYTLLSGTKLKKVISEDISRNFIWQKVKSCRVVHHEFSLIECQFQINFCNDYYFTLDSCLSSLFIFSFLLFPSLSILIISEEWSWYANDPGKGREKGKRGMLFSNHSENETFLSIKKRFVCMQWSFSSPHPNHEGGRVSERNMR